MGTRYRTMSKIGKKIIMSYFIIVIFTIGLSMGITKAGFSEKIGMKLENDVKNNAQILSSQIEKAFKKQILEGNEDLTLSDLFNKKNLLFINGDLSKSDFEVEDINHVKIFESWGFKERKRFAIFNLNKDGFFTFTRPINDMVNKKRIGYLTIVAENGDIDIFNGIMNKSFLFALSISLLITLVLSFIFEHTLIRPINKLKYSIQSFSMNNLQNWENINTNDEISDLSVEFQKMAQNLIKYDKKQKEFFQNTSHELKTPLMSIKGYAEAIRDKVVPEESLDEFLQIIIDETDRLTATVNNIVYLSKLDNSDNFINRKKKTVDLHEFMSEMEEKFKIISEEKNININNKIEQNLYISCDEEQLFTIFNNLISNSMRYAKHNIDLISEKETGKIKITVCDDGDGFDKDETDVIFDRFYKGKKGNTGLGLAIVKAGTEYMRGTVKAYNNSENGGACVEVTLPIK